MKVLTLHQPWASLVALGVKTIETRSWSTNFRGPLAIHAATRRPGVLTFPCGWVLDGGRGVKRAFWANRCPGQCLGCSPRSDLRELSPAERHAPIDHAVELPLGAIVATCTLVDVVPIYGPFGSQDVRVCVRVGGPWSGESPGRATISRMDDSPAFTNVGDQLPYGDFTPGRFAWLLADIVPVDPPVPFKGGQGLTKTCQGFTKTCRRPPCP